MTIFLVIVSYLITVMIVQALRQAATTCTFTVFRIAKMACQPTALWSLDPTK